MLDFEKELNKLLDEEHDISAKDEFSILTGEGCRLLESFNKKQMDISMQIEEIYDLVQDADTFKKSLLSEKKRTDIFLNALVGLSDIIEDFCAYARETGDSELERQSQMMWNNAGGILEACAVTRIGAVGQALDPDIHNVRAMSESPYPREHIAKILQSGYRHMGVVLRKAAVTVSTGEDINK